MSCIYFLFLFVFGLIIGSSINCFVYRVNNGFSFFSGRSFCPKCKKKILWQDNLPLLSFLLLRGRCRWCHSPISWQYPIVELATAILTLITYWLTSRGSAFGWQFTIFNLFITYILIVIFVSDLRYYTIPDVIVFPGIIVSLFYSFLVRHDSQFVFAGLLGAFLFSLLIWLTRGKGMGEGDVKLAVLMGLVLGWPKILVALFLAFLTGAIVGVILVFGHQKRLNSQVPFGPFLAATTWVVLFWGKLILEKYQWWLLR